MNAITSSAERTSAEAEGSSYCIHTSVFRQIFGVGGEGFPLAQQLSNSPCGRPVASSSATPCVMHTAEKYPHVFRAKLFTLAEGPQWGPQYAVVLEGGLYPSLSYSAPHAVAGIASTHP